MTDLKLSFTTLGKYILSIVMCFLITFSFVAIFVMTSTEIVGYHAEILDGEEVIEKYDHLYSDGEDLKKAEAEKKGYTVATLETREELSGTPFVLCHSIAQTVSLVLFIAMLSKSLNSQGRADRNAVNCGRAEENIFRGLKAGLLPTCVSLASWICLLLFKLGIINGGLGIYTAVNYQFFGYQNLIFGGTSAVTPQSINGATLFLALLPAVITLAVCTGSYILGYKDISVYEKTVYKK